MKTAPIPITSANLFLRGPLSVIGFSEECLSFFIISALYSSISEAIDCGMLAPACIAEGGFEAPFLFLGKPV